MLGSSDTTLQCRRHPAQPIGGICALCLKERLSKLACPRCGGLGSSRVVSAACSCTPSGTVSKPVEDAVDVRSARTIASLIESDIEASKARSNQKETEREPGRDDPKHTGTPTLGRSKSISLGKSNMMVAQEWESRSARRKTTLTTLFNHSDPVNEDNAASEKGPKAEGRVKSDKPNHAGAKTVSTRFCPSPISSSGRGVGQVGETGDAELESKDSTTCDDLQGGGNRLIEREDAARKSSANGCIGDVEVGKRESSRVQASRLTKSKSTGWVLNDGWKASPFWGRLIPERGAPKTKKFNIFGRNGSSKCSDSFQNTDQSSPKNGCHDEAERKSSSSDLQAESKMTKLRIQNVIQSRWAILRGRNGSSNKEEEAMNKISTCAPMIEWKELQALGDFSCVGGSPEARSSISSLISIDSQGKHPFTRSRSQGSRAAAWSRSLFSPLRVFKQAGYKRRNHGEARNMVMNKDKFSSIPVSCLAEMDRG